MVGLSLIFWPFQFRPRAVLSAPHGTQSDAGLLPTAQKPIDILDAGVPALSDDAREPSCPSGVHLDPLGLRFVLSTPCPIIVVIFIGTSLLEGRLSTGRGAWPAADGQPSHPPAC